MKKRVLMAASVAILLSAFGCNQEKKNKDRTDATVMYERICKLTKEYTDRLENVPDSADWAEVCLEFEEKLDKISLSYPPDTDLLLTEGQNDTIYNLMQDFVKAKEKRIQGLLHPVVELDSLDTPDSLDIKEAAKTSNPD